MLIALYILKNNEEIKGYIFFGNTFLYTLSADSTTFLLRDARSVNNLNNLICFYLASLKPKLKLN